MNKLMNQLQQLQHDNKILEQRKNVSIIYFTIPVFTCVYVSMYACT